MNKDATSQVKVTKDVFGYFVGSGKINNREKNDRRNHVIVQKLFQEAKRGKIKDK